MTVATVPARRAWLIALVAVVLGNCGMGYAQVESLNPNPTQPQGVGSANDIDISRGNLREGRGIGRGVGPVDPGADENPADTLLKEINGSNNRRRTGRYMFDPRRRSAGYRGTVPKLEEGAVRFDRRGAYEEAIYGSRPGSYAQTRRGGKSPAKRATRPAG